MTRRSEAQLVGVILAAGGSTRMGRAKALLELNGAPLVLGHVRSLARVCARVRVVLGGHGAQIEAALPAEVERVWNPRWAETGMSDSLALALHDLPEEAEALVTPVDLPPAPPEVLRALLRAGPPAVPTFEGRDGHPVYLVAGPIRAALARAPLDRALNGARRVEVAWAETLANLNTPEDWAEILR